MAPLDPFQLRPCPYVFGWSTSRDSGWLKLLCILTYILFTCTAINYLYSRNGGGGLSFSYIWKTDSETAITFVFQPLSPIFLTNDHWNDGLLSFFETNVLSNTRVLQY